MNLVELHYEPILGIFHEELGVVGAPVVFAFCLTIKLQITVGKKKKDIFTFW